MTNNERKLRGIPLRRKIVHNRGAYKHWVDTKINLTIYKIMSEIICTRPYPTPFSMLEAINEFYCDDERLKRISKTAEETIKDISTYRLPI